MDGSRSAGRQEAKSHDSYFDDGKRFLYDAADSGGAGTGDRRARQAWVAGSRGGQRSVRQDQLRRPESAGRTYRHRAPPPFGKKEVEIVGVSRNVRYGALRGDFRDVVYVPFSQGSYYPVDEMTFALRTAGDPLRYVNTVRAIVHQADSRVPVTNVKTQAAQIDQTMNQEILFANLCTAFAILALVIACVGLYGTMSYAVARRTSEIGI